MQNNFNENGPFQMEFEAELARLFALTTETPESFRQHIAFLFGCTKVSLLATGSQAQVVDSSCAIHYRVGASRLPDCQLSLHFADERAAVAAQARMASFSANGPLIEHLLLEATRIFLELKSEELATWAEQTILDSCPVALSAVNARRQLRYQNGAFRQLLAQNTHLSLHEGQIRVSGSHQAEHLTQTLKHMISRDLLQQAVPDELIRFELASGTSLTALLTLHQPALPGTRSARSDWLVWIYWQAEQPGTALSRDQLRQHFSLTATEADLAIQLFQGLTPKEFALQRGVAESTVRKQLRHVLRKTGTSCQEELIKALFPLSLTVAKHSHPGQMDQLPPYQQQLADTGS